MIKVTLINLAGRALYVENDGVEAIDGWMEAARATLEGDPEAVYPANARLSKCRRMASRYSPSISGLGVPSATGVNVSPEPRDTFSLK